MKNYLKRPLFLATAGIVTAFAGCDKNDKPGTTDASPKLENRSVTPALIKKLGGFENLELFTLIGSDDELPNYRFAGSADGAGMIKDGENYLMYVNNEDNYSVSKITLDKNLKPVKGEYALNSDGGTWRLCSGTMVTPAEHGFGPIYLSAGESDVEAMTHGIQPFAVMANSTPKGIAGLGRWSAENAVPLNKNAYAGKTVVLIGEDASDASGGQLVLYVSNTVGDLDNGLEYMLKRSDDNQTETAMVAGTSYDVDFVKIDDHKTKTGAQIQAMVDPLKAIKFGRVEDIDYRKGAAANNREIYFTVTGQAPTGVNAARSRTVWGRVYKLVLDATNPLKGKLTCILDGDIDTGIAKDFQNPDNICVTENFVYIQEDSNGYGTEDHDAYIYQYSIAGGELKKVFELDHRRTAADAAKYNVGGPSSKGGWEYGALVDVSETIGVANTFMLCIQPHSWTDAKFAGVDGGTKRPNEKQGSQVILIKGLPK
jgi:hypothetical protein